MKLADFFAASSEFFLQLPFGSLPLAISDLSERMR